MQEIINEEMYCLVAPDGAPQYSTLAPDFPSCVGFCQFLSSFGMSKPVDQLFKEGFTVIPVKISVSQNGDENTAFKQFQEQMKSIWEKKDKNSDTLPKER